MPAKIEAIQWSAQAALTLQNDTSEALDNAGRRLAASRASLEEKERTYRDLMAVRHDWRRQYRTGATAHRMRASRVASYIESGTKILRAEDAMLEATVTAQTAEQDWLGAQRAHRIAAGRVVALIAVARLVDRQELSAFVTHRRASI